MKLPLLLAASTLVAASTAFAASVTYSGGATGALNVAANWNSGAGPVPGSGDIATWTGSQSNTGLTFGADTNWQGISYGASAATVITGANTLTLGTSGIDMSAATANLTIGNSSSTTNVTLGGSQTWTVGSGRTLTVTGRGATGGTLDLGANTLTVSGSGTVPTNGHVSLSGVKVQNGSISVTGGTLDIRGGSGGIANVDATTSITVASGATYQIAYNSNPGPASIFDQALTLNGGTFRKSDSAANTKAVGGTIALGTGGGTINNAGVNITWTIGSVISGSSLLTFTNTGSTAGTIQLNASSSNTGGVTLSSGTLVANAANALGTSGTVTFNNSSILVAGANGAFGSGTVTFGNVNASLAATTGSNLTFSNALSLNTVTSTSKFGAAGFTGAMTFTAAQNVGYVKTISVFDNTTVTFDGVISGTGSLAKTGNGTLVLTKANSYSNVAGTVVTAGTLVAGHVSALSSGAVAVNGGTLRIGAGGVTLGAGAAATLNVASGATLQFADATSVLTVSNGYTLTGNAIIDLNGGFGGTLNQQYTLITGAGAKDDGSVVVQNGAAGYTYSFSQGVLTVTAVPEPSAYGLLGAGTLAAVAMIRRRRSSAAKV